MNNKCLVIGARSVRQGTGPFISTALHRAGANIAAIVGTTDSSVAAAQQQLEGQLGITCNGYTELQSALAEEQPDIVALCSPWQVHAQQLHLISQAGCHCLAEKPLLWPGDDRLLDAIIAGFTRSAKLLEVVAQWPLTLPAFCRLHGEPAASPGHFAMRLSPMSLGPSMVIDSAPHFLSMLEALTGPGECQDVKCTLQPDALLLRCSYVHQRGTTSADLLLKTCEHRPRPAWIAIDGKRAERSVTLPDYAQSFIADGKEEPFDDPIGAVVDAFLHKVAAAQATDGIAIRAAQQNLETLARAVPPQDE